MVKTIITEKGEENTSRVDNLILDFNKEKGYVELRTTCNSPGGYLALNKKNIQDLRNALTKYLMRMK